MKIYYSLDWPWNWKNNNNDEEEKKPSGNKFLLVCLSLLFVFFLLLFCDWIENREKQHFELEKLRIENNTKDCQC